MPGPQSSKAKIILVLQVILTASMYFILARLSLYLQFQSSHATPVWPSSGFAFAMMLIWGYRIAPGILIGAFAANLVNFLYPQSTDLGTSIWISALIGIGNTGEALVGTYLLRKLFPKFDVRTFFEKVYEVILFLLVGTMMCLVSSTIGTTVIYLSGILTSSQFPVAFITWWLGDFAGIFLVTTLILMWNKSFHSSTDVLYSGWERKIEIVLLFIATIFVSGIIFNNWFSAPKIFTWAYWIIPVLVWAAVRFNPRELITAVAINSSMAVLGTIANHGPFGGMELNESLLSVQGFVSILVITLLILNTSIVERRKTEKLLRDTGSALEVNVRNRTAQLEERENELREITSALEQQNKDLANMNDELSSFAFVASHDLQEPLRKIQLFSKRMVEMERDNLSENGKDYLDRMNNAANRMQLLIENLLTYSRTKNTERKFESTSLEHILMDVKEELKDDLIKQEVSIQTEGLPILMVNHFQFHQLFQNLINNSIKFSSPDRSLVININTRIVQSHDILNPKLLPTIHYCMLTYADNGIGFESQFNEQIFGLFQRLHEKNEYPGTGIGLSICKKIVENHNGFITASGYPGKGATFYIYVPMAQQFTA